jgi:hypothetical protein
MMNATLSRSPAVSGRSVLLIGTMLAAWVFSALGTTPAVKVLATAPALTNAIAEAQHAAVCHCAHCPGIKLCCCGGGITKCP